ncbi:MAG TPA: HAMP domain-containing sensor histidine kinase [Gaiellaceae bacterium]
MTLRLRLTLGVACLLAIAVAAGFATAYFLIRNQLRSELDNGLRQRAAGVAAFSNGARPPGLDRLPRNVARPRLGEAAGYFQLVRSNGTIVLPPAEQVRLPTTGARDVAAGRRGAFFSEATVAGTRLRIYTRRLPNGTALEVARPLTEIDSVLSRVRILFLVISLLAVAVAAAAAMLLSRMTLRPVRRLTEHAERIAATGDLRQRTDQSRSDELGRLAVSFNTMLDALTASVSAQRQLVADASHELRTPLATARTNLEVLELHDGMPAEERRRILSEAIDELKEMTLLIDELVELARGDVQTLEKHPTRLDLVAGDSVAAAARWFDREFRTELEPTVVDGSATALGRAIANLLSNAVKWSPPDTTIDVAVSAGSVSVRDRGAGIASDDLPHIFDRFYRAASARTMPGSGLGLAIVRQIAEAHGGTVTARAAEGGGTIFTLTLPVSRVEVDEVVVLEEVAD